MSFAPAPNSPRLMFTLPQPTHAEASMQKSFYSAYCGTDIPDNGASRLVLKPPPRLELEALQDAACAASLVDRYTSIPYQKTEQVRH